jgi:short-subunit dehydrogenase
MRWQTALITGGSTGIGAALARSLVKRGTRVALAARKRDPLLALAAELGMETVIIEADLADPYRAKAVVEEAHARLGRLDLVIANAGTGYNKTGSKLEVEHIVDVLRLNVLGACATVTAAIPYMMAQGSGHLAGISSVAGYRGLPTSAAYCASKAALSVFLESLRLDLRRTKIKVTDVQPGFIDTPLTKKNKFKMPFLMTADRASEQIVRALERGRSVYAFPWPTATFMRLVRLVPNWIFDPLASRAPV